MRLIPTVLITATGVAALAIGAGVLAQPNEPFEPERDDLPPILVGARLDAPAEVAAEVAAAEPAGGPAGVADGEPDGSEADRSEDAADADFAANGFGPDAEIMPLATLPGREHTMSGYGSGSGNSDLPLEEGVDLIAFDDLMLPDYVAPAVLTDEVGEEREVGEVFPEEILALDGQRVALEGFMMPLEFSGNKVTAFVLSPYPPGCCFGGMPMLDEWVDVTYTDDEGVDYFAYRVVRVTGELEVGEQLDDWGYVASLYRMRSDKVEKLW